MVRAHMLGVSLFIAFWVVLGFIVFFVAVRGGPRGARDALHPRTYRGSRMFAATLVLLYIGFGIAIPALFLHGNSANASSQVGGIKLTAADKRGRELFYQRCGLCHTLAAANAIGKVGPDLDVLRPSYQVVLNTINNGCLQTPPPGQSQLACLGQGVMPAGVYQGRDARDVADFVAKVAGQE
jgi:mono/diheme cytochrome c family protein